MWNTTTYTLIATLTNHTNAVSGFQLLDDFTLISSSLDGFINIWNLTSGQVIMQFNDGSSIYFIKLLANRTLLASGDSNNEVNIWDLSSSNTNPVHILSGHTDVIYGLEVIDENTLASASNDKTVIVWNLNTWSNKTHFTNHTSAVYCLKLIGNGIIASGSYIGELFIWNTTNGNLLRSLTGHTDGINRMDLLSVDVLVSVSWDKTIRMWNTTTGALLKTLTQSNLINSVKMSNNSKIVSSFFF